MREACAAIPIFVEGFVASVDAVSRLGALVSTPRAPRSAQGPDLIGALQVRPPLLLAERVRLRVFETERTSVSQREGTVRENAAAVAALLAEGRAFVVTATARSVIVLSGAGSPLRSVRGAPDPSAQESSTKAAAGSVLPSRMRSGVMLPNGDVSAIASALERGARVVAMPFMGRIGTLESQSADIALPAEDAAAAFAAALCEAQ